MNDKLYQKEDIELFLQYSKKKKKKVDIPKRRSKRIRRQMKPNVKQTEPIEIGDSGSSEEIESDVERSHEELIEAIQNYILFKAEMTRVDRDDEHVQKEDAEHDFEDVELEKKVSEREGATINTQ